VPLEAMTLIEDIQSIRLAINHLESVSYDSISFDREHARVMLRSQIALLRSWERYARGRLRRDYLA